MTCSIRALRMGPQSSGHIIQFSLSTLCPRTSRAGPDFTAGIIDQKAGNGRIFSWPAICSLLLALNEWSTRFPYRRRRRRKRDCTMWSGEGTFGGDHQHRFHKVRYLSAVLKKSFRCSRLLNVFGRNHERPRRCRMPGTSVFSSQSKERILAGFPAPPPDCILFALPSPLASAD